MADESTTHLRPDAGCLRRVLGVRSDVRRVSDSEQDVRDGERGIGWWGEDERGGGEDGRLL